MPKYIMFLFYYANYLTFNNTKLRYKTSAKCELYLLHLEKSISSSLYHGITTTYKTQLTNQRTSNRTYHHFRISTITCTYLQKFAA